MATVEGLHIRGTELYLRVLIPEDLQSACAGQSAPISQTLSQEQDVTRTRDALEAFAAERGLALAAWFVENESEASLKRPEPFRLLGDCNVLLIKQVDRLSRLNDPDREALKPEIGARGMRSSTGLVHVLAEHRDHGRNHGLHPGRCD